MATYRVGFMVNMVKDDGTESKYGLMVKLESSGDESLQFDDLTNNVNWNAWSLFRQWSKLPGVTLRELKELRNGEWSVAETEGSRD